MKNFLFKHSCLSICLGLLMATMTSLLPAGETSQSQSAVYVKKVKSDFNSVYKKVYKELENNNFYVAFEPNIGKNISGFAKRWGKDYNQNKLDEIQSMVFCNGWYANKVSNADPDMLALCPLHLTMTSKNGVTSILFVRPGKVASTRQAPR